MTSNWLALSGGAILGLLSASVIAGNGYGLYRVLVRKPGYSAVPLFGALFGIASLWLITPAHFARIWWIPLLVDYGSAPLLLSVIVFQGIRRLRKGS